MSLLKIKPFSIDQNETFSFGNVTVTANLVSGNANLGNSAIANYFSGNGSMLSGIVAGNVVGQVSNALVAGTVYTAAQPNITSIGTLTGLSVSGNTDLGSVANVKISGGTNGYVLKTDGAGNLTWGAATAGTGNANVGGSNTQIQFNNGTNLAGSANLTFDTTTNTLTATNFVGNGSGLTSLAGANVIGTVALAEHANVADVANVALSVNGANVTGTVANATTAGTANSVAGANVTGTVSSATTAATVTTAAQPNITSVGTLSSLSVTGNVSADYFIGDGSQLTGLPAGYTDANVAAYLTTYTGNLTAGNITTSGSSGNISGANVVTANLFVGSGISLTDIAGANVIGTVANATYATTAGSANSVAGANVSGTVSSAITAATVTTAAQPNITSVGTLSSLSVTGALAAGDTTITGNLTVTGTTTSVNSTVTQIVDPIIELGGGANGATLVTNDGKERGQLLHYYDGAAKDAFMGWMNTNKEFTFASSVTVANNTVTVSSLGNIKAGSANLGNLVTSNYFSGNGSLLSSINGANVTGTVALAEHANVADVANVALSVNGANVTGTVALATHANVADTANAVAGANVSGTVSSATTAVTVTTAAQPNITSTGTLTSITVSGTSTLGDAANVKISGGSNNYVLKTDGTGNLSWTPFTTTTMVVDSFVGDGSWTMKTLSATPLSVDYTILGIGGVLQPRSSYSVLANVITFSAPPPDGADVEITTVTGGASSGSGGSSGPSWTYEEVSTATSAVAGYRYIVDTSSTAITITLPSTATLGDEIMIIDGTGNASTNNITVDKNGGKIMGSTSNMTVSTDRAAFTLVYYNSTQGWVLTNV